METAPEPAESSSASNHVRDVSAHISRIFKQPTQLPTAELQAATRVFTEDVPVQLPDFGEAFRPLGESLQTLEPK